MFSFFLHFKRAYHSLSDLSDFCFSEFQQYLDIFGIMLHNEFSRYHNDITQAWCEETKFYAYEISRSMIAVQGHGVKYTDFHIFNDN